MIGADESLPPVPMYSEPGEPRAVLLDGAHRIAVSIAYGHREIPCALSRDRKLREITAILTGSGEPPSRKGEAGSEAGR